MGAVKDMCVTEGDNGDGYDLVSTLCKYDLWKGDLFVLSWARVRQERLRNISLELLMCGGSVRSILLPLVARDSRCMQGTKQTLVYSQNATVKGFS